MRSILRVCELFLCVLAVSLCVGAAAQHRSAPFFNVMDYGAHKDSSASSSEAFRAAIAAASKAGGGTVYVPAGTYVAGPIEMVSNLTLYISAGATVRFPAMKLPFTPGRQQGIETLTPIPLIGGHDLENVAVIGRGTLTSNNEDWMRLHSRELRSVSSAGSANGPNWERLLRDLDANRPVSQAEYRAAATELRPSFIRFMNSKNILIDGLHLVGSPMWTVHLLYSQNATVENLVIETFPGVHADGIVVDSSRFVRIANDYIDSGDDGIVMKAGKDADGLRVNRPTEDVTITNCTVHHAQGAVVIGSETSGSIRNVAVSNITATDTVNGIHIKSRRGRGGTVEDIRFNNITMRNVSAAITISDAGYQMEGEAPNLGVGTVTRKTPVFRNIAVSNVTIDGAHSLIHLDGIQEMPISGLRISNITGTGRSGLEASYTDDLEIRNVELNPLAGPAFLIRHSTNLEMANVSTSKPLANTPVIRLEATPGTVVRDSRAFAGTEVFLSVPRDERKDIVLEGNALQHAQTPVELSATESWPAARPVARESCLVQFDHSMPHPVAVDSQSRICLDILARTLARMPDARLALIGNDGMPAGTIEESTNPEAQYAKERATNCRNYLVREKGIDASRIETYVGVQKAEGHKDIDKIEAEMVAGLPAKGNVETFVIPKGATIFTAGLKSIQ